MPRYRVQTYITEMQEVAIEATSPGEALRKAADGEGEDIGEPEFIDMEFGSVGNWQVEDTETGRVWTEQDGWYEENPAED